MPYELRIDARRRTIANAAASLADFETTPGGTVEADWIVQNPNINLYALDPDSAHAIFVEVPSGVNLAAAPFVYQGQYENASRLFAMSFSQLVEVGESLGTKLDRLILIFNIARCGSTLLHQTLNQVPGVVSLSEPDGFMTNSVATRLPAGEATALMQATARFLFRPQAYPQMSVPAIKFRARDLGLLDKCHAAFPQATLLFLYREAIGWVGSMMRMLQRIDSGSSIADKTPLDLLIARFNSNWGPISLDALGLSGYSEPLSSAQGYAFPWLVMMEFYLRHVRDHLSITALNYTDLNQHREETLTRLFEVCGLPRAGVQLALAAYERDSQAGTLMGREEGGQTTTTRLTTEQEEEIRALVSCHPVIRTPNFVAPNTI